jgi:NAD(P)-dependent dehydrogenase (short-subunit alcohol dehydrogenase family)
MADRTRLSGGTVIVTGAGSGIGEATARLCADRGARVAVADVRGQAAESVAAAIRDQGGRAAGFGVDVSDEDQVHQLVKAAVSELGPLTGMVNNAGVIVTRPLTDTTLAEWNRTMAVNATGVFLGCRAAIREFLLGPDGGAIVNTGSISANVGLPEQSAYCASKGAVLQLSRQIAIDYAAHRVRCNVVSPGSVTTSVLDSYLNGQSDPGRAHQTIVEAHPMKRLAAPQEIAEVIVFLLSQAASFVTGAQVMADGGYTAI